MGKIKKFAPSHIRKITGGKDPQRLIEEFIARLNVDAAQAQREHTPDHCRWMVAVAEGEELEILLEGIRRPTETTIYLGVNIVTVPIRGGSDLLATALEIADGLVGIKVSLVGHYLVLSASAGASGLSLDDIEYFYQLITAQRVWFRDALLDELGWERLPGE